MILPTQLRQLRKMGPLAQILEMLPGGMGQMAKQIDPRDAEKQLKPDRSGDQLNDQTGAPQSRCAQCQPAAAHRPRLWHRCAGRQPADQAVPGGAAFVQNP